MTSRLSPLDVSFLYLEEPTTAMHVGSAMIFQGPPDNFSYERLVRHVEARIALIPRYRQRVRWVPGRLANPVWVDDENFDITYHVRRSALPRPGSQVQLQELVARLQSRQLDRSRPLWELVLVEGLEDGGLAVVTKVHQALVDGVQAMDLSHVVLDDDPDSHDPALHPWHPDREPSAIELLVGALAESVRRPQAVVETLRSGVDDVRATAGKVLGALGGLASTARTATRPTPRSPLNPEIGASRRFQLVATNLEDYRRIRNRQLEGPRRRRRGAGVGRGSGPVPALVAGSGVAPIEVPGPVPVQAHSGELVPAAAAGGKPAMVVRVNDVVLSVLAGALRSWLLTRGEAVPPKSVVRALVPMSVRVEDPAAAGAIGSRVASLLVDLPTGESSPLVRLHQIAYQTKAHRDGGQAVDAPAIAGIAGFAPPTLHSLGARVASGLSRRMFNLVITNVPGPQLPLYLLGSRMLATYPVIPLARGQALSVGLTSYDGGVYYGLNGDREAMPDLDVLGQCIVDALAEMVEAAR